MTTSPLKFARSFEQLKSRLQSTPAGDLSLLVLVEFWPELKDFDSVAAYQSYFDEYLSLLLKSTTEQNLHDLLPPELSRLFEVTLDLRQSQSAQVVADEIEVCVELVATEAARKYFYVGAIEDGLTCLSQVSWAADVPSAPEVTLSLSKGRTRAEPLSGSADSNSCPADVHICRVSDDLSEFDALRDLAQHLSDSNHELADTVRRILRDWEVTHEALSFEEATCLFVEKNDHGDAVRGRLRLLHGTAEYRRAGADTNEVTFDSQLRAPDDPFVGVVYDALEAVNRRVFTGRTNGYVRARFHVVESDRTFSGDSIGLAAGLVAYTQLLQPELLKHERFLAYEAVFTGGVDSAGQLTSVNETTLKIKIERAFFSPLRYLVLPGENLEAAQACVDELQAEYPRRRLILVGANTIAEVIENRNIVRAEKVCMGQFVTRRVVKYSRATKIQVPILLALLYALICLIYPKAWLGFDWNPQYVTVTERGFNALNIDSVRLWSVEYECDAIGTKSKWRIGDLDSDDANEIAFAPMALETLACDCEGFVFVYDKNGNLKFKRSCTVVDEYPNSDWRSPVGIKFANSGDSSIIITTTNQSYPTQAHIRFWSTTGDSLGWYINAGMAMANDKFSFSINDSTVIFVGINNGLGSTVLFAIRPESSIGVSPPYSHPDLDLTGVTPGNQKCYILFPPTDLNRHYGKLYNSPHLVVVEPDGLIRVETNERCELPMQSVFYYLDTDFRVVNVKLSDTFMEARSAITDIGSVSAIDWAAYTANLRDSVRYWTDSGWVTEGELRAVEDSLKTTDYTK